MHRKSLALGVILATALSSATALAPADAAPFHHATGSDRAGSYQVTVKVNKNEPMLGSKVKIKASVSPAAPGAAVTLQVRYEDQKRWNTIDRGRLTASSKVTFKDKAGSVRERKYRVVKPASGKTRAGHGTTEKVLVFGWRDLTSLPVATYSNMGEVESLKINGVAYPNSVRSYVGYPPPGNVGSIEYNLNRSCKAFLGTAGLDDSSPAAATATIQLSADGSQRYSGTFGLTQSAPVAFDVTKVFRLSVATTTTGGGFGAVGTPEVLCSF
jgi:hypothetical protein